MRTELMPLFVDVCKNKTLTFREILAQEIQSVSVEMYKISVLWKDNTGIRPQWHLVQVLLRFTGRAERTNRVTYQRENKLPNTQWWNVCTPLVFLYFKTCTEVHLCEIKFSQDKRKQKIGDIPVLQSPKSQKYLRL